MEYNGWSLFDTVLLICRKPTEDNIYQAYLCDPKNKKQIENARFWGKRTEYGDYDKETRSYPNKKEYPAIEFEFENKDFEFELYDSADGSSQGGKLSFWNCLVKKNGNTFKVGINADLLLNLLLSSNFKHGKCENLVSFARRNGGVGVLHEGMKEYQLALQDMESKQKVKKKTSKHVIGRNYVTLTEDHIYLGDFYQWYEPIYEERQDRYYSWYKRNQFTGYKRLEKPIVQKLFCQTKEEYTSVKEYCDYCSNARHYLYGHSFRDKLPSRMEGDIQLKLDATNEDWENVFKLKRTNELKNTYLPDFNLLIALSTNSEKPFDFPDELIEHLKKHDIKVEV